MNIDIDVSEPDTLQILNDFLLDIVNINYSHASKTEYGFHDIYASLQRIPEWIIRLATRKYSLTINLMPIKNQCMHLYSETWITGSVSNNFTYCNNYTNKSMFIYKNLQEHKALVRQILLTTEDKIGRPFPIEIYDLL